METAFTLACAISKKIVPPPLILGGPQTLNPKPKSETLNENPFLKARRSCGVAATIGKTASMAWGLAYDLGFRV